MATAKLEFDLNDPQDQEQFDLHNQAEAMLACLQDISGRYAVSSGGDGFKDLLKYDCLDKYIVRHLDLEEFSPDHKEQIVDAIYEIVSDLEDNFYDILQENNVKLDVLS